MADFWLELLRAMTIESCALALVAYFIWWTGFYMQGDY